jgi:predicted MFS family arabinose efflux permease
VMATRVPESLPAGEEDRPPPPLVQRAALAPGLGLFCGVAAMSAFLAFAALQAKAVRLEPLSIGLLVFGAVVVGCRLAFAGLPDRVAPLRLSAAALVTAAAGLLVLGGVRTSWGLLLGAVVLGAGTAFLTPAVFAAVFSAVPAAERGSAAATTSIFIDLGLSSGPMVLGTVAASTSIPTAFLLVAPVPVAGALVLLASGRGGQRDRR